MNTWTVAQLSDYSGKQRSTVQHVADRFSAFLSSKAAPGDGNERRFTPQDVAVLLEVWRQTAEGSTYEQVESGLKASEFKDISEFPDLDEPPDGTITLAEHKQLMGRYEGRSLEFQERAEKAEALLQEAREEISALKREVQILREMGSKEQSDEITKLKSQIAVLQYQLGEGLKNQK